MYIERTILLVVDDLLNATLAELYATTPEENAHKKRRCVIYWLGFFFQCVPDATTAGNYRLEEACTTTHCCQ